MIAHEQNDMASAEEGRRGPPLNPLVESVGIVLWIIFFVCYPCQFIAWGVASHTNGAVEAIEITGTCGIAGHALRRVGKTIQAVGGDHEEVHHDGVGRQHRLIEQQWQIGHSANLMGRMDLL